MKRKPHPEKPKRDPNRYCKACGVVPDEGPLPYEWDGHDAGTGVPIFLSCSDECRAKLGVPRRKPIIKPICIDIDDLFT